VHLLPFATLHSNDTLACTRHRSSRSSPRTTIFYMLSAPQPRPRLARRAAARAGHAQVSFPQDYIHRLDTVHAAPGRIAVPAQYTAPILRSCLCLHTIISACPPRRSSPPLETLETHPHRFPYAHLEYSSAPTVCDAPAYLVSLPSVADGVLLPPT
jgi:hypothetical protein